MLNRTALYEKLLRSGHRLYWSSFNRALNLLGMKALVSRTQPEHLKRLADILDADDGSVELDVLFSEIIYCNVDEMRDYDDEGSGKQSIRRSLVDLYDAGGAYYDDEDRSALMSPMHWIRPGNTISTITLDQNQIFNLIILLVKI